MLKHFLILFIFICFAQADKLENKIENLLGDQEYTQHKKLVSVLFAHRSEFYDDNDLKLIEILNVLKKNGLLKLKYNKPQNLVLEFSISGDPIKSLKILNDTLKALGYYYYFTKKASYNADGSLLWIIDLKTKAALDPLIFTKELRAKEIKVTDINKVSQTHWQFEFDTKNGKISQAIKIDPNEKISFEKPLDNYFVKVKDVDTLKVISRKLNRWFPYIVFYDRHLNVLKVIKKKRVFKGIKTDIPKDCQYIKIGDLYNLINIKRGLSVVVQNANNKKE